jgi:plastocyanin/glucose/arabinose dehydrogenase
MRDATVLAVGGTGASGARLDRAARRGVALAAALAGVALAALAFSPPPAAAQDPGSVLLYTGTTGFRHTDAINNGRPVVQTALEDAGYTVTWEDCNGFGTGAGQCRNADENPRVFTEANLANYDAILLLNASDYFSGAGGTPGQLWNASEEAAIIDFVQNGGGVAAVHNMVDAGAGQTTWDWWDGGPNSVVGSIMTGHAATDINNTADVQVADRNHLSTRDLPDVYEFGDEHYSWQRNVRGDHHVLATLDESTYNLGSSASMGNDHPISWCKLYDGDNVNDGTGTPKPYDDGRTWLTAMGHFGASYTANGGDNNLVDHIVGGVRWVAGEGLRSDCSGTVWSSFTRTILVDDANGPIDIDIAADGKVYWSEIGPIQGFTSEGYIKMHDQSGAAGNTTTVATIPTRADHSNSEDGVLGMALEPGFDLSDPTKRDLYVYYSPRNPAWPTSGNAYVVGYNVISRFTLNASGTAVVPGSEQEILRVPKVKLAGNPTWCTGCPSGNGPGHVGGAALEFDSDGNLYLGVGDDVSPNEAGHNAYPPLDYRAQEHRDARKTAANTGDLRGKIVRVHPLDEIAPGAEPGIGTTYSIPEGNLFAPGTADARPEIYAMGFRQPFTVHTDPANPGTIGVGEYCHDNSANMANRAPAGVCEWNLISEPGFHGWPFCVGTNNPANTSYRWDYASGTSTGSQYDCSLAQIPSDLDYAPTGQTNPGPTNPGLANIPGPAVPATIWKKYTNEQGNQFGDLGPGGMQPITGPIYRYDPETAGPGAFPAYYDGSWLIHNRGSDTGFWKDVRLRSDNNQMLEVYNFLPANQFGPPNNGLVIPVDFGPDGALYMGRFQVGCCRNEIEPGDITEIVKIEFNVQDECLEDTQAPNVSHQVAGQPHPTEPDTYLIGGLEDSARLTVTANDVGCAGVDQVEYRVNSDSEDDWQPYTGQVPFTEAGEFAVDYRATDDFGNTSEIGTATFTVAEANDTAAPAVEATVSGSQNEDGDYIESATLALEATDAISGIESIEHSVNGGAFIETSFDGSNPSESTQVEFDELGEYTVEYRATDTSGNTSTVGEVSFTVVAGDGCVGVRSDEFDGDMLDPERWTTVRNPLEYPPVVGGGSLTLPILDEVDGTRTGPFSYVAQQVPEGDWSATTRVTVNLDLYDSWHQAGLILWQSDGNFVKYVFGRDANSGELRVEMASDNPTDQRETGDNAPIDPGTQTVWLRLNREGNTIFGELALDEGGEPGEWMAPAIQTRPVDTNPPREGPGVLIGLFAGSDVNPPPYEGTASFDFFRIEPDEQNCPDDTTPPETTAQLNGADPEPTYDGPVEVTLSATDPGGGSEPQTHQVTAEGFVWDPDALEAAAGDTVEWDFSGGFHDICLGADEPAEVTAGSCGTDEELGDAADTPPDTGGSKTFPEPGSFVYYCTYHFPSMVGDLTVTEGGGTPGSGVAETSYSLDGGAPVVSENTAGSDPFVTEFAVSEPGSHEVDYFSTDEAGNVEATESVSFEIEEGGGEPELRLGVSPSRDRVRVGQTAAFTATVRNTGDGSASNLRVCVKAPKSKLRVVGKECVRSGTLDPGERMTPRFRLKPKRSARGDSVRVTFTATAAGLGMERDTATVKVKR